MGFNKRHITNEMIINAFLLSEAKGVISLFNTNHDVFYLEGGVASDIHSFLTDETLHIFDDSLIEHRVNTLCRRALS